MPIYMHVDRVYRCRQGSSWMRRDKRCMHWHCTVAIYDSRCRLCKRTCKHPSGRSTRDFRAYHSYFCVTVRLCRLMMMTRSATNQLLYAPICRTRRSRLQGLATDMHVNFSCECMQLACAMQQPPPVPVLMPATVM